MNRILLEHTELGVHTLAKEDRRSLHLRNILKVKEGQHLQAGLCQSLIVGKLEIQHLRDDGSIQVCFRGQEDASEMQRWLNLSLIVGLPRPPVLKRLLRDAASCGVEELVFFAAQLCEGDYRKSKVWQEQRELLVLGAEQGCVNRLPRVRYYRGELDVLLAKLVETEKQGGRQSLRLLFEKASEKTSRVDELLQARAEQHSSWTVAVGPERGWTERESQIFHSRGFQSYSLGPWTLRTEVAVHMAIGLCLTERKRCSTEKHHN